jgi:signal transduction histidine kinase
MSVSPSHFVCGIYYFSKVADTIFKLSMTKPAILTIDDEPEVLNAIERDLRKHFAAEYRILKAGSGAQAMDAVRELKKRNATVALFLVDARMPQMSGTEFLVQARQVFPDARKVLLTAYADTGVAIDGINLVQLDHSRMKVSPGDVFAEAPSETLTVPREHFPEMILRCPQITETLVHVMVDRTRYFTSSDLHDEKMKSLGKLAAGLAHELNNPASAVVRSAKSLVEGLVEAEEASRALGAAQLTRSQREAETAVTLPALDRLAEALHGGLLDAALRWVAHGCAARSLAREIETAGSRIYELVAAVKGFTQVDRETAAQPLNVGQSLADTLTMLRAKVKAKSATVAVAITPGIPPVMAYGGELNQVWLNLIDNALDAVAPGGRVEVSADRKGAKLAVRIADNGPGIPNAVLPRIFDPFFTTKPVGQGTGLGLDIVRRLVNRHNGEIDVESRPGHTVFTVSLPLWSA